MRKLYGCLKLCFLFLAFTLLSSEGKTQATCPVNIGFDYGDFTGWQCYVGTVTSSNSCSPTGTNTVNAVPSPPLIAAPQPRHSILQPTTSNDPFGNFPMTPDNSPVARLGFVGQNGSQIERISYQFTIPSNVTSYTLTYKYAVVYQDPNHCKFDQPHFEAKVYNVTTGQYINCASFEYYATPGANGFQTSPNTTQGLVYYKPWTPVTFLLSDYIGQTIRIEFTNADCPPGAHWAYCYVDVVDNCSNPVLGAEYCEGAPNVSLTAPFGYNQYNWFNVPGFGTPIGTGSTLTMTPPPPTQTNIAVEVIPLPGFGCRDTIYATVKPYPTVPVNAGVDRIYCGGGSNQATSVLGSPSQLGYTYLWYPSAGLSDPNIAQPIATPGTTTDYILLMTDNSSGCQKSDTVRVTVAPPLTAAFSVNNLSQCVASNNFQFTSSGSNPAGTTYNWNFGNSPAGTSTQANPSFSYSTPGSYTVKLVAQSPSGCVDTSSQVVTVTAAGTANAGPDITLCSTSPPTAIGSPAITGYTYSWSPATGLSSTTVAQPNASPSVTTQYILTITTPGGCVGKDTMVVTMVPSINPNFSINNASQCLSGNSFQFSSANSNPQGVVYAWSFGDAANSTSTNANPTFSYSAAGTYTVKLVVSASGGTCKDSSTQTVTVNAPPLVNAGPDGLICGGSTQSVTLGTAAVTGNTYSWSPATGLSSSTAAQPTAQPTATTQYILTVTGAGGCTAKDTVNVTVTPAIIPAFTINNASQCLDVNNFLFTSNSGNPNGSTFSWNFGDGMGTSAQANPSYSYTAVGTYTVKLIITSGTCKDSSTQTVTVNAVPVAAGGPDHLICGGSGASVTIGSPAVAGFTYSWSPATGLSNASIAQPSASPSATTQYILTVTGAGNCVRKDTVVVSVSSAISPAFTINASSQCLNVNAFQFTSSPSNPAGLVYSWTFGDGVGVSTQASPTYSYTSIGTYTVKLVVSAAGGTCKDSSTQTVTVNAVPVAVAGADALLCAGTSQTAPLGGPAAAGVTYSWSPAAGLSSATASNPTAQPTTTTQYIVTATGAGGCFTKDTVVVTVVQTINPAFTVNSSTQCLNVNNFSFTGTSSNAAGLVYTWTFGDGAGATGVTASHSYAALGSYTVKLVVSTPTGSCKDSSTQTVTVAAVPVATAGSDQTICAGASTTIGGAATAGVTYSWSPATGLSSATASNPTASPSTTTQYIVTATGAGTCASKDTVLVTVLPTLQPAFTVNNATQCITGNSFVFTMSSPASGLSYAWTFGDGVGVSTQQNPSYSYTAAGTYTVTLTLSNANGCSTTSTKTVTVNNLPVGAITAAGSNICEGTPVVLSASGTATSFKWYKDGVLVATTPTGSYNALAAGNYTVTLDNGCPNPGTGQVTLTLTKKPVVDFSFTTMCLGYPTPFTDKTTTVGSGTVSYSWNFQDPSLPSSTQTSPTVTYGAAGTYNVGLTVTPQLCPSLATTVTKPVVIKGPEVGITYTEKAALENVPLQLLARNIGVGYVWSPATLLNKADIRQPVFKGAVDQQYTITITDDRGCVTVDTQLVKVYKEVNVYMPKGFSPNGDGLNDYIHPFTVGIKEIRLFRIINRWGVTVFEARGTAAQTGWDGRYKGTPQPMDGFVWEIQAIDFFGKQHVKQGSFTLLR